MMASELESVAKETVANNADSLIVVYRKEDNQTKGNPPDLPIPTIQPLVKA
jgi:hypothetical protein